MAQNINKTTEKIKNPFWKRRC